MAEVSVTGYAAEVATTLNDIVGPPISFATTLLTQAAANVDAQLQAGAAASAAAWSDAVADWTNAQNALGSHLQTFLKSGLPAVPGLEELLKRAGWGSAEGLHGDLTLGPLKLSFASSALIVRPPAGTGLTEPLVLGPYRPSSIAATFATGVSAGKGLPGGGALVRLPDGFGGTIQLPLGVAAIDATAILQRTGDGTPTFLAVLGVGFTPPIQLSFGFSLDRVGGLVGVNRTADVDALGRAVRTGAAADLLFAARPPKSPAALVNTANELFPQRVGRHLVGPSLKISWLSSGAEGSLLGASLAVIVEIPTAKVVLVGLAQAEIPRLPDLLHIRIDVQGLIDPLQQLVAIDASLVDSHVLGAFTLFGDAAMRVHWGSQAYAVLSIGGFFPGFNPEPARLPALRRVGMALKQPLGVISIRAEAYLAVTTNTLQLGARLDVHIGVGLSADGFLQVDALIQFRPFHFEAHCSAGFRVSVSGFTFGGVRLDGTLAGPGPLTLSGRLTIETFLFDFSWSETIRIGGGSPDALPAADSLLDRMATEIADPHNLHTETAFDADVVLAPASAPGNLAALPPTGTLRFQQAVAPLRTYVDRVDGRPLDHPHRVQLENTGADVSASFAPGGYLNLTDSEKLTKPPFDTLPAGAILSPAVPGNMVDTPVVDPREIEQIVILNGVRVEPPIPGIVALLTEVVGLVSAAQAPPALGDNTKCVAATSMTWDAVLPGGSVESHSSATAAFQMAKQSGGAFAVSSGELGAAVDLAGV